MKKDYRKIGKKISKTQKAKRTAERIINLRVKKLILKELYKKSDFRFIKEKNINFSFFDIPTKFKKDYRELIEKFKKNSKEFNKNIKIHKNFNRIVASMRIKWNKNKKKGWIY